MPQVHLNHVLKRLLSTRVVVLVLEQILALVKSPLIIEALQLDLADLLGRLGLQWPYAVREPLPNLFGLIELASLPELDGPPLLFQVHLGRSRNRGITALAKP